MCVRTKEKESGMERQCNYSNLTTLLPLVQLSVLELVYSYWKNKYYSF